MYQTMIMIMIWQIVEFFLFSGWQQYRLAFFLSNGNIKTSEREIERESESESESERNRDRDRDRDRDRQTDRQTESERETDRVRETDRQKETETETESIFTSKNRNCAANTTTSSIVPFYPILSATSISLPKSGERKHRLAIAKKRAQNGK